MSDNLLAVIALLTVFSVPLFGAVGMLVLALRTALEGRS